MLKFYVYADLREDGTPYYIGKGSGNRAWVKSIKEVNPPKDMARITIVEKNLTNVGALSIERYLIRWYGRKDIGTGILRNKTDGGDGVVNPVKRAGVLNPFYGKTHTDDVKRKIRDASANRSLETKLKMGAVHKGKPWSPARRKSHELRIQCRDQSHKC